MVSLWMRFRSWLARLISPAVRFDATPEEGCPHDIPPAALLRLLRSSLHDPFRHAELLMSVCPGCHLAALEESLAEDVGRALAAEPDRGPEKLPLCGHRISPEDWADRLEMCRDLFRSTGDAIPLARSFRELDCFDCLVEVWLVGPSDTADKFGWRPDWDRQLHRIQYEPEQGQ